MVLEVFFLVEKFGLVLVRVDSVFIGGVIVFFGVERSLFLVIVDIVGIFSSKVVSLNLGSLVINVVLEIVEKLVNYGDVNLDRVIVYLFIVVLVVMIVLVVVVFLFFADVFGGMIILVVVNEFFVLEVFLWNIDVNRVLFGLEV